MKIRIFLQLLLPVTLALLLPCESFAGTAATRFLNDFGVSLYDQGRYEEASTEFKKVLILDPSDEIANKYLKTIKEIRSAPIVSPAPIIKETVVARLDDSDRDKAMAETFKKLAQADKKAPVKEAQKPVIPQQYTPEPKKKDEPQGGLNITGEIQFSMGIDSDSDIIWKRANYDLNERNWRMLSEAAYNRRFNTYDPRIYDSLRLNLDTAKEEGFNFHTNLVVDPWSFTGRSNKFTVTGLSGDSAEIELKYWSNTGYTISESIFTTQNGDSFNVPELKVTDGKVKQTAITSTWSNIFTIPETEIEYEFQPIREFWVDYATEGTKLRVFPIAYQDQAYSSDDPLSITNNHVWWEDSPWLRSWKHGNYNSGTSPVGFTKGYWNSAYSFLARDSSGAFLTSLRGVSLNKEIGDGGYFTTTIASPKDPWQEYSDIDNAITASRMKLRPTDDFSFGATFTTRTGFNEDDGSKVDSTNYVGAADISYQLTEGVKTDLEVLKSYSQYDLSNSDYETESRGWGYYFAFTTRYPSADLMGLRYGYDEIQLGKNEPYLLKSKLYAAHLDEGFDSALSTFHNTRSDTFWSRHISFRKPQEYYYAGLHYPSMRWDEIYSTRLGSGIDIGRDAIGFRVEYFTEDDFHNLFDIRNVHYVNGKYIETVARDETTMRLTDKLTAKTLALYHDLPKTKGGIDPFIIDSSGDFAKDWSSDPIDDGLDPSLKTGSIGLEYYFTDWVSLNGVWEHTNDYTLAYGNYPRALLNSAMPSDVYSQYDKWYRDNQLYLYDQQLFPQPPYPYYDIYKAGINLSLSDRTQLYLDYVRNEFAIAGQNSDNMNHAGVEITHMFSKRLGMAVIYRYSRWKDLDRLRQGITKTVGHHNVFTELRYLPTEDSEFIFQYGEGNTSPIGSMTFDPLGGSLLTIDTQHIIRLYYRQRF